MGGVVIAKSIEITGEGPSGEVILESTSGPCVEVLSGEPRLRGLTLRCAVEEFDSDNEFAAVRAKGGHPILEGCVLSAPSYPGLAISGEGTHLEIRRSRVQGCGHVGSWSTDVAR
jgi:hypothetical protein